MTTPQRRFVAILLIEDVDGDTAIGGVFSDRYLAQAVIEMCPFPLRYKLLPAVPIDEPLFTTAVGEYRKAPPEIEGAVTADKPVRYCPERRPHSTERCVLPPDHEARDGVRAHRSAMGHTWE